MDSLEATIRAIVRDEFTKLKAEEKTADPDEIMTPAKAAAERGYTPEAVTVWLRQGLIEGAEQNGKKGRWRFTRAAWQHFLGRFKRRNLSRLKVAA